MGSETATARLVLGFAEEKQQQPEYPTGFHRQKAKRKKAAAEEIPQQLREALAEGGGAGGGGRTEPVQYDPNLTVTVTAIRDLDLSGARPGSEELSPLEKPTEASPRKCGALLSQRVSPPPASLHTHNRKVKEKHRPRAQGSTKKPPSATRSSKAQRRRQSPPRGVSQEPGQARPGLPGSAPWPSLQQKQAAENGPPSGGTF